MDNQWSYKGYGSAKPEAGKQAFSVLLCCLRREKEECHYCVWIVDEALTRFDRSGDYASIVSSQRDKWNKWVEAKIDSGDFGNKVLKYDPDGEKEIDLSEMTAHLSMD